jgi:hypothetical protein
VDEQALKACQELIDEAKLGCADLVFKEACLEILPRARNVLSDEEFKHLVVCAAERMKERITPES